MTNETETSVIIDEIPETVQVSFIVPGVGQTKQKYSMSNPHHLATWRANNKLSAAVQTGVRVLKYVRATENNLEKQRAAKENSEIIFQRIKTSEYGG